MRIPFGSPNVTPLAKERLLKSIERNWATAGPNVKEFEAGFAEKFGYGHAVTTSSGTDACICACAVLHDRGASRGDEVIVPALSFVATTNAVLAAGLTPVFVDVEVETLNIDAKKIEEKITPKTRGIQVVHTMGKPCDMDPIMEIARKHGLLVIEDACEAHGAQYKGRTVGSIGDIGVFSFYAAHLVFAGEGGMAVTNDAELAGLLRSVRSHGRPDGSIFFDFQRVGFNSKMNDLEAALGVGSLANFDQTMETRIGHRARLLEATADLRDRCHFLVQEDYELVSPHAFPLVFKDPAADRDGLYRYLESQGIQCKNLFGSLPTQHRCFAFMGHKEGEFPAAEFVGKTGLHFGLHENLTTDDVDYVNDCLHTWFKANT